jgi:hypothetical protein
MLASLLGCGHREEKPPPPPDGIGALTKKGKDAQDAAKAAGEEAKRRREAEKTSE